ncbi:MAG TPA: rhomboid family intramembrane serine protease [Vicinamibacterales bacterium]|jgi:membrane associated rhomboid family serine protease
MIPVTGTIASSLDDIHDPAVPPDREDVEAPSLDAARDIHRDAVDLARGRMIFALSCLVLVPALIVIAAFSRSRAFIITLPVFLVAWAAVSVFEWWTLRRSDPLESWRRERQEDIEERSAKIEHAARIAANEPVVTLVLAAMIIVVTAAQFLGAGIRESFALAGLVKPAVRAGEWWRLLTATYLHGDLLHLCGNASGLLALGTIVEIYDRRLRVPLAYLAGGIAGSVASTVFIADTSVGASGAILGLLGYALAVRVGPRSAPNWMRKRLFGILGMVALTGVAGYVFIDNAGHAGGVVGGFLVGLIAARANARQHAPLIKALDTCGLIAAAILGGGALLTIGRLLHAW